MFSLAKNIKMSTHKNIGLIECSLPGQSFQIELMQDLNGYHLKKAFVTDHSSEGIFKSHYPQVEIVDDKSSIINDNTIELVIVSAPSATDMEMVSEVMNAGKHVRIL